MLTICLVVALLLATVAALKWKIAVLAVTHYLITKGYPLPTEAEIKASSEYAVSHLFDRIDGR